MKNNQSGVGMIGIILTLGFMALLGWFVLNRLAGDDEGSKPSADEIIQEAKDTVDSANSAKEQAESLIPDIR